MCGKERGDTPTSLLSLCVYLGAMVGGDRFQIVVHDIVAMQVLQPAHDLVPARDRLRHTVGRRCVVRTSAKTKLQ